MRPGRIFRRQTYGAPSFSRSATSPKVSRQLLIVATFWHLKLGLQVVLEDYVHEEGWKFFSITLLNFFVIGAGALAFFSVLKIAFGGGEAA